MKRDNENVFDEPWMQPDPERPVTGPPPLPDAHARPDRYKDAADADVEQPGMEQILHSVYSEPVHRPESGETELSQLITDRRAGLSPMALAGVVLLCALVAGPISVLGTLAAGQQGFFGILYLVAAGPVVEEMMKLGGLLFLLEKKPWYIIRGWHIIVAACVSAMLFGVIENLVYGGIYLSSLSGAERETMMEFRWAVTVPLHIGATLVGALGLRTAWLATVAKGRLFDSQVAEPYIAAAVIIHGGYNALALVLGKYLLGE